MLELIFSPKVEVVNGSHKKGNSFIIGSKLLTRQKDGIEIFFFFCVALYFILFYLFFILCVGIWIKGIDIRRQLWSPHFNLGKKKNEKLHLKLRPSERKNGSLKGVENAKILLEHILKSWLLISQRGP